MSTQRADTINPLRSITKRISVGIQEAEAARTGTWHPLPLSYLIEQYGLTRLKTWGTLITWMVFFTGCLVYVHEAIPAHWAMMNPAQSGIKFLTILYPPLVISTLLVFWMGFEWGFIPAYLSVFVGAIASGMAFYWAILLSIAVVLGLAIPSLVYFSVPMAYDLRSVKSLAFFVGTTLISSMASSMGAFLWSHAHGLTIEHTILVWKGWWLGSFVLTIFVTAPLLFLLSRGVEGIKAAFFDVPSRPQISLKWIYGSIVTVVLVLAIFTLATEILGNMRLTEELALLPAVGQASILSATETYHYASWIAIFLSFTAGLGGITLVANWNRSLKLQVQERARALQLSEQRFQTTFEQAAVGMAHLDEDGIPIRANNKFQNLLGYQQDETNIDNGPAPLSDLPDFINLSKFNQLMAGYLDTYASEAYIRRNDGTPIWLHVTISRTGFEEDEPTSAIAVIEDITDRKQMERELLSEKTFSDSLINSLPGVFYLIDEDCNLLRWNDNLENITGYSPSDIAAMNPLDFIKSESDENRAEDIVGAFDDVIHSNELVLQTKKGNEIPFYFTGLSFNARNQKYIVGVGIDISEMKKYEKRITDNLREKETLLAEIHHRVKNNLAVITGLLELQKFNTEDSQAQAVLQDSQSRIYSMALVHEMLYQSESFNDITIDSYIDELIDRIRNSLSDVDNSNIRVEVNAEKVPLTINQAVPLGLLLNEMLTNAFKHAFKDVEDGRIRIDISEEDSDILVIVSDNGQGFPDDYDPNKFDTLGVTLIQRLTKQLQGNIEVDDQNGVTYRIRFERTSSDVPDSVFEDYND